MSRRRQRPIDEAVLRLAVEGTASETGAGFFRALVKNLAAVLGTQGAWVTEYLPAEQKLRALAMWMKGDFVENFEYRLPGTACADVVEARKLIHIPERVIELYPKSADLIPLDAVSYLGMPLLDTDGGVMGHLSVLDNKPMPRDARAVSLFEIFAARASAEHRRLRMEQEVRGREEQLSVLLDTAMDAIFVLDSELCVTRANQAATRLFDCPADNLVGSGIGRLLVEDSAGRLEKFAREIGARPAGQQQLWVPQDFVARRPDASVFPAEATLSRFENRRRVFYTLILRNMDERFEAEKQIRLLTQEAEYLREAVREVPGHDDLLGRSDCMRTVYAAVKQVAQADATVLVTGETGTGKELVARSIHRASRRADKPLVLVNCAAVPANLIESEFFGHERGAFTGAVARREGRFALADGGTIFLDEIGELPLELQAKLLRVLQEGEFEPLGGSRTAKVDVRVVAATHRNLRQMTAEGKFREDLYFRLNVFPIHVPALRERGRDIAQLASEFARRFARRMGKAVEPLTNEQVSRLCAYDWPGNVRELQNVIERAIILTSGGLLQLERAMPDKGASSAPPGGPGAALSTATDRVLTARELEQVERANILRALRACGWRISGERGAARLLGVPPTTLGSRMKVLKIRRQAS
jgi:formate hydrogenlyase transcriptional activator